MTLSSEYPSGSADIDAARREVAASSTTVETYPRRVLFLYLWVGALQQQGADTRPLYKLDMEFYGLQNAMEDDGSVITPTHPSFERMHEIVDSAYAVTEKIQALLTDEGPVAKPREATSHVPEGGDMSAEWPMFQRDIHNTGYTEAPGPSAGKLAWRFPVGLGWYSRPVIEGDRVYVASPSMRTTSFCLDIETGKEIWQSKQEHLIFGIYRYPCNASTPLVLNDTVILREISGIRGQGQRLNHIDKATGKVKARTFAGPVDYRTRYAPSAANEDYLVYPYGEHRITNIPPVCQSFNRLICEDRSKSLKCWDFNIGDIDPLAEPVISGDLVLCGTMEGYLYALELGNKHSQQPVRWNFHADGAINTAVTVSQGNVFFGSNGGTLYCLDESTGAEIWRTQVGTVNGAARKQFSTPTLTDERVYVGDANGDLTCVDRLSGKILWQYNLGEWVRSRPVLIDEDIVAATLDGKVHCVDSSGTIRWSTQVSSHPIYADAAASNEQIVVADSNLRVFCLDSAGNLRWQKTTLPSFENERGELIYTDQLAGGTFYQSKPTAYRGKLYFGTPSGFLFAVDAASGREVWRFEMGAAISVGPACADGKIYGGQQGGERFFYCIDAETGALVWKQTLPGGWVWGSATVEDGMVYVPTVSGHAICLDGNTGHIIWMYPTAKSIPAEPAIEGDLIYFGSWSNSLYAFDKRTGEVVWKQNSISLDSGTLIAHRGRVYVPNHDNIFSSFDAKAGNLICPGNLDRDAKGEYSNFNASPAFHEGRAFFTARVSRGLHGVPLFSTVYCVDVETAEIIWTHSDGGGLSAPAVANGRVYIASGNTPYLYCLDEATGKEHWVYRLGHRTEESTLCIYRDRLYVLSADGYVHCIE